jgi:hypothetical protein
MRRSRTVTAWPYVIRWTFVGLPGYLDDQGRGEDDPRLVKAELYPLDDDMTPKAIEKHLAIIAATGPLCRYTVAGRTFLHMVSWAEHQRVNRPSPSLFPPCPVHDGSVNDHGGLTEGSVRTHVSLTDGSRGEGKGREGSKEGKGRVGVLPVSPLLDVTRATRGDEIPATRQPGAGASPLAGPPLVSSCGGCDHGFDTSGPVPVLCPACTRDDERTPA